MLTAYRHGYGSESGANVVSPKGASEILSKYIGIKAPVLLVGAPGVGKSDIVRQAAESAGADYIVSHPPVTDPVNQTGLPWVVNEEARFLPLGEMAQLLRAERLTVWHLDDLGQAPPLVQASYMQWLLARRLNAHVLPEHVVIIACSNRRGDRAGVSGILEPVKSRFHCILEVKPDLESWTEWAISNKIRPEVIGFLRFKPDLLLADNPSAELVNSPSPRTWTHVSAALDLGLPKHLTRAAVCGAVGDGAGLEFLEFVAMYESLVTADYILSNPASVPLERIPDRLYATVTGLAARANAHNLPAIMTYLERLYENGSAEYAVLCLQDLVRRNPKIVYTAEYTTAMLTRVGKHFLGSNDSEEEW